MREGEKGHRKEGEEVLFGPYEGAGRIYGAACGQEIPRDGGIGSGRVAASKVLCWNLEAA